MTRVTPHAMEFRVGNILPVGLPSLFLVAFFIPFGWMFARGFMPFVVHAFLTGAIGYAVVFSLLVVAVLALVVGFAAIAYRTDFEGAAADGFTLLDRRDRKIYQRVHKGVVKGVWNWSELVPYIETRNALSRVNQALTLVDFQGSDSAKPSFVTVHVVGMAKEPLSQTYSFVARFMDDGVAHLPPLRLVASPEPGWYTSMPPCFLVCPGRWPSRSGRFCSCCSHGR